MAHLIASNVGETSATTGTGAKTLTGAITGMIRFNAISGITTGDTVPVMIQGVDGSGNRTSQWEYGLYTYSAANQLTAATIMGSSNSGSAVNFTDALQVYLAPIGELMAHIGPGGGVGAVDRLIRAAADRTLTSTTSSQAIFNSPANGRITLETGVYMFDALLALTTMSATSGNALINILGAGTATVAGQLFHVVGIDAAAGAAATQTGSTTLGGNSTPASALTAATGTAMNANIRGTFEVTAAGTMIPSLSLVTANAAVLKYGSYFSCKRIGGTGLASVGLWD